MTKPNLNIPVSNINIPKMSTAYIPATSNIVYTPQQNGTSDNILDGFFFAMQEYQRFSQLSDEEQRREAKEKRIREREDAEMAMKVDDHKMKLDDHKTKKAEKVNEINRTYYDNLETLKTSHKKTLKDREAELNKENKIKNDKLKPIDPNAYRKETTDANGNVTTEVIYNKYTPKAGTSADGGYTKKDWQRTINALRVEERKLMAKPSADEDGEEIENEGLEPLREQIAEAEAMLNGSRPEAESDGEVIPEGISDDEWAIMKKQKQQVQPQPVVQPEFKDNRGIWDRMMNNAPPKVQGTAPVPQQPVVPVANVPQPAPAPQAQGGVATGLIDKVKEGFNNSYYAQIRKAVAHKYPNKTPEQQVDISNAVFDKQDVKAVLRSQEALSPTVSDGQNKIADVISSKLNQDKKQVLGTKGMIGSIFDKLKSSYSEKAVDPVKAKADSITKRKGATGELVNKREKESDIGSLMREVSPTLKQSVGDNVRGGLVEIDKSVDKTIKAGGEMIDDVSKFGGHVLDKIVKAVKDNVGVDKDNPISKLTVGSVDLLAKAVDPKVLGEIAKGGGELIGKGIEVANGGKPQTITEFHDKLYAPVLKYTSLKQEDMAEIDSRIKDEKATDNTKRALAFSINSLREFVAMKDGDNILSRDKVIEDIRGAKKIAEKRPDVLGKALSKAILELDLSKLRTEQEEKGVDKGIKESRSYRKKHG